MLFDVYPHPPVQGQEIPSPVLSDSAREPGRGVQKTRSRYGRAPGFKSTSPPFRGRTWPSFLSAKPYGGTTTTTEELNTRHPESQEDRMTLIHRTAQRAVAGNGLRTVRPAEDIEGLPVGIQYSNGTSLSVLEA